MARLRRYTGQPSNSAAALFTATQAETITAAIVENFGASPVTLTMWIVPNGDSATDANIVYDAYSIAAATEPVGLSALVGQTLNAGDALHAQAGSAAALTMHISVDR